MLRVFHAMKQLTHSFSEGNDETIIHSALAKVSEIRTENLQTHVIYAGDYYTLSANAFIISFVFKGLQIHNLKSAFVTAIHMWRHLLITKEKMEDTCSGKNEVYGRLRKESINDDIESVYESLQLGEKPEPLAHTFCLPKLTERELKLIATQDQDYFQTFFQFKNPDVDEKEMKLSESNSKYVEVVCMRRTYTIDNPALQDPNSHIGLKNNVLSASNVSESNSKYVNGTCERWTYGIDNPVFEGPNSSIESINSVLSASNMSNSKLDEEDKKPQCHKCNCCCLQ